VALLEHRAVELGALVYSFSPDATPAQQLCRHVARVLELPPVVGPILASIEWYVDTCPIKLSQLVLSPDDFRHLSALTRAFALSACQGDSNAETRLWKLRRRDGPYADRRIPSGVAHFFP
jgi:hypothetical protein